jgi:hypothetical protein
MVWPWIRNLLQDMLLTPLWCFVMHTCARRVLLSIVNTTCHIPSCLKYSTLLAFQQRHVFLLVLFKLSSLSETWQTPPSSHLFWCCLWLQLNTSSSYSVFRYWIYLWMQQTTSTRISYLIEFFVFTLSYIFSFSLWHCFIILSTCAC